MRVGIRTEGLRKVYTTPPAIGGQAFGGRRPQGQKGQPRPKYEVVALDDLSLEIHPGEIFGLLGPNGAGKSTTVGLLTTRVRPTAGRAWIGDEPSAGLDSQTRLLLSDLVRNYNALGKTILLTTHNMEEADALCHRVAIVDHGKVLALGTPQDLKRSIPGGFLVRLHVESTPAGLVDALQRLAGVSEVRAPVDGQIDVYSDRGGPLVPMLAVQAEALT